MSNSSDDLPEDLPAAVKRLILGERTRIGNMTPAEREAEMAVREADVDAYHEMLRRMYDLPDEVVLISDDQWAVAQAMSERGSGKPPTLH